MYDYGSPDNRRIENRKQQNKKTWSSPDWKEKKAAFLRDNPTCRHCGDKSTVPHHPDLEVYGKPEYLTLNGTIPLCNTCHRGIHSGRYACPRCSKIRAKSVDTPCYHCLDESDKQRIKERHNSRNETKNKYQREQYRKYHPKKEVVNGTWTIISQKKNSST